MTDTLLLQDFITESVEHLEDMETKLLQLESDPGNREILNDIFKSVHTIKGASEYMGMERIAELAHKLEDLLDMLRKDATALIGDILNMLMYARDRIVLLIGDLELTQSEETRIDDVLAAIEGLMDNSDKSDLNKASSELPEEISETSYNFEIPADFISEARNYLEEMEANLSLLQNDPENKEAFNKLVKAIHTIKCGADYMEIDRIGALSRQLETFLLKIRQEELTLDIKTIQLIAAVPKRMAILIGELERTLTEETEIDDLSDAIRDLNKNFENVDSADDDMMIAEDGYTSEDAPAEQDDNIFDDEYDEEYDEELFNIFLEQLQDSIFVLRQVAGEMLYSGNQAGPLLEKYIDCIQGLYSSANYMGYEKLADYYEKWMEELHSASEAGHPGEGLDWQDFVEIKIIARINKIIKLFPQLQAGSAETDAAQEDIASVPGTDEITEGEDERDFHLEAAVIAAAANAQNSDNLDLYQDEKNFFESPDRFDLVIGDNEIAEATYANSSNKLNLYQDDEEFSESSDDFDLVIGDDEIAEATDAEIPDKIDLYQDYGKFSESSDAISPDKPDLIIENGEIDEAADESFIDTIDEENDESEVDDIDETEESDYSHDDGCPIPTDEKLPVVSLRFSDAPCQQETPVVETASDYKTEPDFNEIDLFASEKPILYNKLEKAFDHFMSDSSNSDSDVRLADSIEALFSPSLPQPQPNISLNIRLGQLEPEQHVEIPLIDNNENAHSVPSNLNIQSDPWAMLFSQEDIIWPDRENRNHPSLAQTQTLQVQINPADKALLHPEHPNQSLSESENWYEQLAELPQNGKSSASKPNLTISGPNIMGSKIEPKSPAQAHPICKNKHAMGKKQAAAQPKPGVQIKVQSDEKKALAADQATIMKVNSTEGVHSPNGRNQIISISSKVNFTININLI